MNSVLQSLVYIKPLQELMLLKSHKKECKRAGFCCVCALEDHAAKCLESKSPFTPKAFILNLKKIAKHFRHGRQEDSHEFLRFLVDGMHEELKTKRTSPIQKIFGGSCQSQVKCLTCKFPSNTIDPIMDISLDIKNCNSVEQALYRFTAAEILNNGNQYKCEKCKKLVDAQKQTTIKSLPKILTIQLKRFGYLGSGKKVNRHVKFSEHMNLKAFLSDESSEKENVVDYNLVGVLVHAGHSCGSGHYFTFVKSSGSWYRIDDEQVQPVNKSNVLSQSAYLLFYERLPPQVDRIVSSRTIETNAADKLKKVAEEPIDKKQCTSLLNSTLNWSVTPLCDMKSIPGKRLNSTLKMSKNSIDFLDDTSIDIADAVKSTKGPIIGQSTSKVLNQKKYDMISTKDQTSLSRLNHSLLNKPNSGFAVTIEKKSAGSNTGLAFEHRVKSETSNIRAWNHLVTSDLIVERNKMETDLVNRMKRKRATREDMLYDAPLIRTKHKI
jgi:ubiquitin C-terminal hydrolase